MKLKIFLTAAAMTAGFPTLGKTAEPQNILLIFMEDLGCQIGPYGDHTAPTPALDRLASEGVTFKNAYCTQANCSPSRASLYTGVFPHQNGQMGLAESGGFFLRPGLPNFLQMLKSRDYYTGCSYKIHVDPESVIAPFYDKWYDFKRFARDGCDTADYRKALEYMDDFLANRPGGRPFYYMAQTADTHRDYVRKKLGNIPFNDLPQYHRIQPGQAPRLESFGPDIPYEAGSWLPKDVSDYYNAIQRVDAFVDGCLRLLTKYSLDKNTVVIFSADHGPGYGRGKLACHELGVKVPVIARWPEESRKGQQSSALISLLDIMPTLLESAGIPKPDYLEGKPLQPLIYGEIPDDSFRETLFTEYTAHSPVEDYWPMRAVRDHRWKLIHNLLAGTDAAKELMPADGVHAEGSPDIAVALKNPERNTSKTVYERFVNPPEFELYDLSNDPYELHDLSKDPSGAKEIERLKAVLLSWRQQTKDPFLDPAYFEGFTQTQLNKNAEIATWEKAHPKESIWKHNDLLRPDWSAFILPWDK